MVASLRSRNNWAKRSYDTENKDTLSELVGYGFTEVLAHSLLKLVPCLYSPSSGSPRSEVFGYPAKLPSSTRSVRASTFPHSNSNTVRPSEGQSSWRPKRTNLSPHSHPRTISLEQVTKRTGF